MRRPRFGQNRALDVAAAALGALGIALFFIAHRLAETGDDALAELGD